MTEHVGVPADIDEAAAARSRRLTLLLVGGIAGGAALAGVLASVLLPSHPHHPHHASTATIVGGITGLVLVLAASIGVVLWIYRRPGYRRIMQYGWRRRMRTVKALRRGRPIPPEDRPVAAAIIEVTRRQRWVPFLLAFLPIIWVINGFSHHGVERWIQFAIAGLYVLLLPVLLRQRRRLIRNYDALIASTPGPGSDPTSDHL